MATVTGLTAEQARSALRRFGPNALPLKRPPSLVQRLGAQLKNALIYLLLLALLVDLVAWAVAGARGVPLEAVAILGVILLNAALGVLQEFRSERALLELRRLSAPRAWVLRSAYFERIDTAIIVPGDVVRLEAGDRVPADGAALQAETLSVDESALTGRSKSRKVTRCRRGRWFRTGERCCAWSVPGRAATWEGSRLRSGPSTPRKHRSNSGSTSSGRRSRALWRGSVRSWWWPGSLSTAFRTRCRFSCSH